MMSFFDTRLSFLPNIGSAKAELIGRELGIFTYGDLLEYFPFRYEDRTKFVSIVHISEESVQIKGTITHVEVTGQGVKQRLVADFNDVSGSMELLWFQGIKYFEKSIRPQTQYIVYGKAVLFNGKYSITHPEIEVYNPARSYEGYFQPIYSLTDKLRRKFIDHKQIALWQSIILMQAQSHLIESLPEYLIKELKLINRYWAFKYIHNPKSADEIMHALRRLKFEELFYNQLRLLKQNFVRKETFQGQVFNKTHLLNTFYSDHLPFDLTNAQKNVIREVFADLKSGKQMNRLIQGDVGSGKTIVAFICILLALDSSGQACLLAPTEILARQHYTNLAKFAADMSLSVRLLTGSSKKKERETIHQELQSGVLQILIGTHAILEDVVRFQNLGLCVIDEQHRFGVAQRATLWEKNKAVRPHIMVMTATPIPRTLAMTLYGDLDVSEINELPPGRKPIKTVHHYDTSRLKVYGFLKEQLQLGRQIYIVYPLIEESEKLDLKNLQDGYEAIVRYFPDQALSMVHGKMKSKDREFEMERFKSARTSILVATTVIEVGVDVPNASVMLIENAERFGLSQLHQLRGRVGRGADQSYCILMTDVKLGKDSRTRIDTMVKTQNGFEIAQVDLQLRGPGDLAGTVQSGIVDLKLSDLAKDEKILKIAREKVQQILAKDPEFQLPEHHPIKGHLSKLKGSTNWSRIS